MYFLYKGCFTRLSTSTVTVLFILLLITRPTSGRLLVSAPSELASEDIPLLIFTPAPS